MKYLFLAYSDEQQWEMRPKSERGIFDEACIVSNTVLQESGYLLASETLHSGAITTVWVQNGSISLNDGPLARTNEQLVGLFFINARDLNEAIQVAAKMPQTRRGPIEVRLIN